jgi:hypothetical protein
MDPRALNRSRLILVALGKNQESLLEVHKALNVITNGTGLTAVLGEGAGTGSQLAEAMLRAIFVATGADVGITLVIRRPDQAPDTARGGIRGGAQQILMLHTGAHFSLLHPKQK